MQRFVIMGVSGCGKSSVGEALEKRVPLTFFDGDTLHPKSNIQKMSSGIPLDDDDRAPWLAEIGRTLRNIDGPTVVGCSSLKRKYRDIIRKHAGSSVGFIHLFASKEVLTARVKERKGHFMPPALLDSQYADLEQLEEDEGGIVLDISASLEEVVQNAEVHIQKQLGSVLE